jgi:hypothetical protein
MLNNEGLESLYGGEHFDALVKKEKQQITNNQPHIKTLTQELKKNRKTLSERKGEVRKPTIFYSQKNCSLITYHERFY